jgi:hypothetical protein
MQGGIDLSVAGGLSLYVVILTKYPAGKTIAFGLRWSSRSSPRSRPARSTDY